MFKKITFKLSIILKNNSFLTLILRLIGVVFIFLTTYFFTNYYDSQIVGLYDFTRSYFLVFGSLIMLSSDQTILYLIGRYNKNKETIRDIYFKIFVFCLVFYFVNIIFFYCIDYLNFFDLSQKTTEIIFKSNFVLFFYCIYLINIEIYRALNYTFFSEIFRNIIKYVPLIVGFILLNTYDDPYIIIDFFIFGFVFISLISSLLLIWMYNKENNNVLTGYKKDTYKEIINYSIPITVSTVSIYLLSSIDIFFLKYYYGDKYVAYYSVAFKITSIIGVAINAIGLSIATEVAYNFKNNNKVLMRKSLNKSAKIMFYFSVVVSLLIAIGSNEILNVFGKEYIISKTTLFILLIGSLLMSIAGNSYIYMLMTNKGKLLGKLIFISVLINFLINFLLIPKYGIEGAAFSSVISILIWNFGGAYFIYKKDKINILYRFKL